MGCAVLWTAADLSSSFDIYHSYSVDITVTFDSEESVILNDDGKRC